MSSMPFIAVETPQSASLKRFKMQNFQREACMLFACFGRPLKLINHLAHENQTGSLA
jgi:hypothetical protein